MKGITLKGLGVVVITSLMSSPALAHDPVFGIGPHVLYKDGFEISVENRS